MTDEQQARLERVRERATGGVWEGLVQEDITFLLSLLDSDSQAAAPVEGIADDLPYRIVEAMGLGLTFRSCSCGQLPCARLRPLRDALETVRRDTAAAMRDKCVEKLREMLSAWKYTDEEVIAALSSLTLDQVKPEKINV